jgi:hypothetical protein
MTPDNQDLINGPDLDLFVTDSCPPNGQVDSCLAGADLGSNGQGETVNLNLTANTPYLVFVSSYSTTSTGPFHILVTSP